MNPNPPASSGFGSRAPQMSRWLILALACTVLSGCAVVSVAGAAAGAAIDVAGAVASTTVKVTGKVIEKTVDAVMPGK